MFYKRVVVYIPTEETYKALKHKTVDDGLTLNALMLTLIERYLNGSAKKLTALKPKGEGREEGEVTQVTTVTPVTPLTELTEKDPAYWAGKEKEFDNAMPRQGRGKTEPVEMSVKAFRAKTEGAK